MNLAWTTLLGSIILNKMMDIISKTHACFYTWDKMKTHSKNSPCYRIAVVTRLLSFLFDIFSQSFRNLCTDKLCSNMFHLCISLKITDYQSPQVWDICQHIYMEFSIVLKQYYMEEIFLVEVFWEQTEHNILQDKLECCKVLDKLDNLCYQ